MKFAHLYNSQLNGIFLYFYVFIFYMCMYMMYACIYAYLQVFGQMFVCMYKCMCATCVQCVCVIAYEAQVDAGSLPQSCSTSFIVAWSVEARVLRCGFLKATISLCGTLVSLNLHTGISRVPSRPFHI